MLDGGFPRKMINVRMKYAVGGVMSDIAEGIGKKPFVPPLSLIHI